MDKLTIGITIGDFNGVGLEVILKTLADTRIFEFCTPVLYGSSKIVSYHKNILEEEDNFNFNNIRNISEKLDHRINIVNCWQENVNITLGKLTNLSGKYAHKALEVAVQDAKDKKLDAIVTAPIHKKAMQMADFSYPGHTEYLSAELGVENSLMLMVNDDLRIGVVSGHIPLKEVADHLSKKVVLEKIKILNETLKIDFGLERPMIGVLGLNPHAGDEGAIGTEEVDFIKSAVAEAKRGGIMALGPFPADGFFGTAEYRKYDAVLAMYHDQGLVPFKLLSFGKGVNYTAGLPCIRTSPDHGTAYNIAGRNEADPASFRKALFAAITIFKNRQAYLEMHENPILNKIELAPETD